MKNATKVAFLFYLYSLFKIILSRMINILNFTTLVGIVSIHFICQNFFVIDYTDLWVIIVISGLVLNVGTRLVVDGNSHNESGINEVPGI